MNAITSSARLLHAACLLAGPVLAFRAGKADAGARLARALERLGPAYIKLGQMLATRPDIVVRTRRSCDCASEARGEALKSAIGLPGNS